MADAPPGLLTSGDRLAVEVLARWRRQGLAGGELAVLRGFLNELGASPAVRARVALAGPQSAGDGTLDQLAAMATATRGGGA